MTKPRAKRMPTRSVVITLAVSASACGAAATESRPLPLLPTSGHVSSAASEPSLIELGGSLSRHNDLCHLQHASHCPEGAPCNPPMPERVACPPGVASDGTIVRALDGICTLTVETCPAPLVPTCNPPPPQQVPCEPSALESGLQTRQGDGHCYAYGEAHCPEPYQPPCTPGESMSIDCPPPE